MKLMDALLGRSPTDKVDVPVGLPSIPMMDLRNGKTVYPSQVGRAYFSNAFRACLLAKARPIASLPIDVYERREGVRVKATGRVAKTLSRLLRHRWNPLLTSAEGMRWAVMTKDTLGNAFIRVEWSGGVPVAMWPMSQTATPTLLAGGEVVYEYSGDAYTPAGRYLAHEVVWLKSPILDRDGVTGVSLAELAASELGMSIDLDEFYTRLLRNGSHFPGYLSSDQKLDKKDIENIEKQLSDHEGVLSAGKLRIFDKGLTYSTVPLTMADMSLVEQERWILQQCCRTLSVPPQEVYELSNSTYSNMEQGALDFAKHTLVPECDAIEDAVSSTVLWAIGNDDKYVSMDMDGLLRGSYKERMEGYRTAILGGWMSPNMALAKEDEAPYEGGQYFFRSSAYIPVDPETGEELEGARGGSVAEPGGSGEGTVRTDGAGVGRPEDALAPIRADMARRVRERFADKGDSPSAREFARKVLSPYAEACAAAGIAYDIDTDIDELAEEASHA